MTGIVGRARNEGIQKGLEQGLEQGLSQGQAEGERTLLLKQLQRRFGELDPTTTKQRLDNASTEELERWGENVLEAQTLEEVFSRH